MSMGQPLEIVKWFVLKNRRHLGPFTQKQLQHLLKTGRVALQDFVVEVEKIEAGKLDYIRLSEVVQNREDFILEDDVDLQTDTGFEENEEPGEASRIFAQSLMMTDLVQEKDHAARSHNAFDDSEELQQETVVEVGNRSADYALLFKKIFMVGAVCALVLGVIVFVGDSIVISKKNLSSTTVRETQKIIPTSKSNPLFRSGATTPKQPTTYTPRKAKRTSLRDRQREQERLREQREKAAEERYVREPEPEPEPEPEKRERNSRQQDSSRGNNEDSLSEQRVVTNERGGGRNRRRGTEYEDDDLLDEDSRNQEERGPADENADYPDEDFDFQDEEYYDE